MPEYTEQAVNPALDRLLTEADVRDRLRCGHSTYYALIASGQLPSVKVGRRRYVRESDLAGYIAGLATA